MKKLICAAFFALPLGALGCDNSLFVESVAPMYLGSFPVDVSTDAAKRLPNERAIYQKKLSKREIREIIFNILKSFESSAQTCRTVIDATLLKNLEFFCGGEQVDKHLFGQLNRTKTVEGELALARILANPTYDLSLLESRQDVVRALLKDSDLQKELEAVLAEIAAVEPLVFGYWSPEDPMNEKLLKTLYFPSFLSSLNKSVIALEVPTRLQQFFGGVGPFIIPSIFSLALAMVEYKAKLSGKPTSRLECIKRGVVNFIGYFSLERKTFREKDILTLTLETHSRLEKAREEKLSKLSIYDIIPTKDEIFKQYKQSALTLGDQFHIYDNEPNDLFSPTVKKGGCCAFLAYMCAAQVYSFYAGYKQIKLNNDLAKYLQAKLIAVQRYVRATQKLEALVESNPNLRPILGNDWLGFNKEVSPQLERLLKLLDTSTFSGNPSIFSLVSRILVAHQLMKELKDEFAQRFVPVVGGVDAHLSIANLVKEHQKSRAGYCFVEFVQSKKPIFQAIDFWNPFIDPETVVTNSIELGDTHTNNIVLTGPNTAGKSTVIKSTVIDTVLAHTLAIAPAARLRLTPFAVINCSMNIADDIASGTSLFKAEVKRAKLFADRIKNLEPFQFAFTVMDEVFSGTSPEEGEHAAYQFTEQLGKLPNSICSVATHFPKLPELESKGLFKNYHVGISRAADGSLIRSFRLQEGRSTMNVAMDLLQQEGVF